MLSCVGNSFGPPTFQSLEAYRYILVRDDLDNVNQKPSGVYPVHVALIAQCYKVVKPVLSSVTTVDHMMRMETGSTITVAAFPAVSLIDLSGQLFVEHLSLVHRGVAFGAKVPQ